MGTEFMRVVRGIQNFRLHLLASLLTNKPVFIKDIRSDNVDPGVKEHEIKFLELLTQLTQGTIVEISDSGTEVKFTPGVIRGGNVEFECGAKYGIAYFLEPLIALLPFAKLPTRLTLSGLTADRTENGMDSLKYFYDSLLQALKLSSTVTIKIANRGFLPDGIGKVSVEWAPMDKLDAINLSCPERVEKIRGMLASTKVNGQICINIVNDLKEQIGEYFDDIFIYTDNKSLGESVSSGYSLALVGTCADSPLVVVSETNSASTSDPNVFPESSAKAFLKKVAKMTILDDQRYWVVLSLMAITHGVSTLTANRLPDESILKVVEDSFGVKFAVKRQGSLENKFTLKCSGMALTNIAKEFK